MTETKVFHLVRKLKEPVKGDVGLEIEVEPTPGRTLPSVNNEIWVTKEEGSLRNGGLKSR